MADQSSQTGSNSNSGTGGTSTSSGSTTAENAQPNTRRSPEPKVMDPTIGVLLKSEYDKNQCRDVVSLKPGQDYKLGTVLGKIKASALCVAVKATGTDGSEIAVGVLIETVTATNISDPIEGLMLARGPAIVSSDALIFDAGFDEAKTSKAINELSALGIVARTAA